MPGRGIQADKLFNWLLGIYQGYLMRRMLFTILIFSTMKFPSTWLKSFAWAEDVYRYL